jgi:MFS superfamily sulfate permease-like transporter
VTDIDYTGANMLRLVVETLRAKGIQVGLARLSSERASEHAARTGSLDAFGAERVFRSVEDAVRSFKTSRG